MFLRRKGSNEDAGQGGTCNHGEFGEKYPAIWEYLSTCLWPDGSPRRTSTLNLFVDPTGVKASLKDRDGQQITFVTARSPDEALEVLEDQLRNGTVVWRPDEWKRKK